MRSETISALTFRSCLKPSWNSRCRLTRSFASCACSLFARYGTCGKETCSCRTGEKHGPYFVLSTRSGGRGGFQYLEDEQAQEAKDLVSRHREFQEGLRQLRKVSGEIVSLLKRYQAGMARQGQRRLRMGAAAS